MTDGDNDNLPFPGLAPIVHVEFEFNEQLRGLMDVAKVAIGPGMAQAKATEALLAVRALLAIVDRAMPPDLQAQDPRLVAARRLERDLASLTIRRT